MQLRTLQTIDGLGPTSSNTVVLAVPIDVMDSVNAFTREHHQGNGRLAGFSNDPVGAVLAEKAGVVREFSDRNPNN
jgi:hypothetical protein